MRSVTGLVVCLTSTDIFGVNTARRRPSPSGFEVNSWVHISLCFRRQLPVIGTGSSVTNRALLEVMNQVITALTILELTSLVWSAHRPTLDETGLSVTLAAQGRQWLRLRRLVAGKKVSKVLLAKQQETSKVHKICLKVQHLLPALARPACLQVTRANGVRWRSF